MKGWIAWLLRPPSRDAADSVDSALETSTEGIRALKISLMVTAPVVVLYTGSTGAPALDRPVRAQPGPASTSASRASSVRFSVAPQQALIHPDPTGDSPLQG